VPPVTLTFELMLLRFFAPNEKSMKSSPGPPSTLTPLKPVPSMRM